MAQSDPEHQRDPIPVLKAQLAAELVALLDGWERYIGGSYAGVDGPRISDLRRGNLTRFSLQKLIRMLARLGRRTTITVTPTGERHAFRKPNELLPPSPHRRTAISRPPAENGGVVTEGGPVLPQSGAE